jgi:hypothetical protein
VQAIKGIRDKVQITMKFAFYQDDNGNRSVRGELEYVSACCKASLKRLDVECIDLYYQHRLDPKVPIEITVRINLASTLKGHTLDKICKGGLEIIKLLCINYPCNLVVLKTVSSFLIGWGDEEASGRRKGQIPWTLRSICI